MTNLYYILLKKLTQESKKLDATLQCLFFIVSFILDRKNFKKSSGRESFSFGSLSLNSLKHCFDSRHTFITAMKLFYFSHSSVLKKMVKKKH